MNQDPLETVRRCAALARLDVDDDEARALAADFARILEAFRGLAELDPGEVEPMVGAARDPAAVRPDEPRASLSNEALLAPAPQPEPPFFRVPKTVDADA